MHRREPPRRSTPEDSEARRQERTGSIFRWVGLRLRLIGYSGSLLAV
ncbi:MAG: hypothetical protein HWQ41_19430 [Nostoc sp. NOS(2021)]|nr:hypothetical protein [Nostoc sp. NOS(2021)]MBN3897368.1 hypothetical protein [Nostoc sp. NOS(2021)]